MTEGISDQGIIERLREIESSLWETLLENRLFEPQDISELIQNPVYMVAHQKVTNRDRVDLEQSWEDEQITLLYDRINEMLDAIPAIQYMQFLDDLETSKSHFDYYLDSEIQESVQAVLERARSKLYDVRTEYASFGETSGDQAGPNDEERQSNQRLGLQLKELLTLLPAASLSTGAKKPPLEIVRLIPANSGSGAKTPEETSNQPSGVLEVMRRAAQEAAGTFAGTVQNLFNHLTGRDRTQ